MLVISEWHGELRVLYYVVEESEDDWRVLESFASREEAQAFCRARGEDAPVVAGSGGAED